MPKSKQVPEIIFNNNFILFVLERATVATAMAMAYSWQALRLALPSSPPLMCILSLVSFVYSTLLPLGLVKNEPLKLSYHYFGIYFWFEFVFYSFHAIASSLVSSVCVFFFVVVVVSAAVSVLKCRQFYFGECQLHKNETNVSSELKAKQKNENGNWSRDEKYALQNIRVIWWDDESEEVIKNLWTIWCGCRWAAVWHASAFASTGRLTQYFCSQFRVRFSSRDIWFGLGFVLRLA